MSNLKTWSTTAASNNQSTPDGWPEGQAPSTVNDCGREMMASIRTWYEDAQWIDYGHTPTYVSTTQFSVSGDQTTKYAVGRRVRIVGASTGYGSITASSYGAPNTTVTVTWDSGNTPTSPTTVAVGIITTTSGATVRDGSSLTSLNATNISSGSLADARLSANVPLLNAGNTFTAVGATLGTSALNISSSSPWLNINETDQGADGKLWHFGASGGNLVIAADADGGGSLTTIPVNITRSGTTITSIALAATALSLTGTLTTPNTSASEVGYKGLPIGSQTGNYTLVLSDADTMIYKGSGATATWTIPANASVAFPPGTCIVFSNRSGNAQNIAITTDTLVLAGAGTTGTRSLANNGIATATKVNSTEWLISGAGLS